MYKLIRRCLLLCAISLATPCFAADKKTTITVFAAASLTDALESLQPRFTSETGIAVRFSFAASSALARQIEAGARADIFFSADTEWLDYLQKRNLLNKSTRRDVISNQLVLIAPANSTVSIKITNHFPLASILGKGRLATGDPDTVPVGKYAKAALSSLGVWTQIAERIIPADNVRTALQFVRRGEAPLGIVYRTDALMDKQVRIVDVFPVESHSPITYPIAATADANTDALRFIEYMSGPTGAAVFKKFGFTPLPSHED